jgi:3-oxoacyl-[acyl-carrier protein] reductase
MMRLKEKVAIITGGGSGIGEATAMRFSEEGARVVVADIIPEGIERISKAIKDRGGEALPFVMDHTKKEEVQALVDETLKNFSKIDILINNAGKNVDAICKKMTEEQFDEVIDANLKGPWLCCQAVIGPMSDRKYGRIVNTSSVGAHGNVGQTNYSSAKAGVIALTKSLALELARYNITVNCVAPGATETPLLMKTPKEALEAFMQKVPLKRFATPSETANTHLFLASDEASYITGQTIFVAGGLDLVFK